MFPSRNFRPVGGSDPRRKQTLVCTKMVSQNGRKSTKHRAALSTAPPTAGALRNVACNGHPSHCHRSRSLTLALSPSLALNPLLCLPLATSLRVSLHSLTGNVSSRLDIFHNLPASFYLWLSLHALGVALAVSRTRCSLGLSIRSLSDSRSLPACN